MSETTRPRASLSRYKTRLPPLRISHRPSLRDFVSCVKAMRLPSNAGRPPIGSGRPQARLRERPHLLVTRVPSKVCAPFDRDARKMRARCCVRGLGPLTGRSKEMEWCNCIEDETQCDHVGPASCDCNSICAVIHLNGPLNCHTRTVLLCSTFVFKAGYHVLLT